MDLPQKELTSQEQKTGRKGLWKLALIFFILVIIFLVAEYFVRANESIVFRVINSFSSTHSYGNTEDFKKLPKLKYSVLASAPAAIDILIAPNSDKEQIKELLIYLFELNAPTESYKTFIIRVYNLKEAFEQRSNDFFPEEKYWAHHLADISRDSGITKVYWNRWDKEKNKSITDVEPVY